jgi:hypothetical protein
MEHTVCPGSRTMRQPVPEMFQCPTCREEVEIWSDEIKGSCLKCGTTVMRDGFMSCLDWCAMGKDCVGDATYGKYMNNKAESIKTKLIEYVADKTNRDTAERIYTILKHAEQLSEAEQTEWHIVLPACILNALDSSPIDEISELLAKSGFLQDANEEICSIITKLRSLESPIDGQSPNFKVVRDALAMSNETANEDSIFSRSE